MKEYKILESKLPNLLEIDVNAAFQFGWHICGSAFAAKTGNTGHYDITYYQLMIREK